MHQREIVCEDGIDSGSCLLAGSGIEPSSYVQEHHISVESLVNYKCFRVLDKLAYKYMLCVNAVLLNAQTGGTHSYHCACKMLTVVAIYSEKQTELGN
jgi:hypothetical protein